MSKSPNQLPSCLKSVETTVILIDFDGVLCQVHAYIVTVSNRQSA